MDQPQNKILISAKVKALLPFDDHFTCCDGFSIQVAKDTKEFLQFAREQHPDVIFTSPSSAQEDRTCCRLLREDSRISDIPIVAVIDSSKLIEFNHIQYERPDDVLFTPINSHLFFAAARRILGLAHRSFLRLQTSLLIHYGLTPDTLRTACAFNLSSGGIFIATDNPPAINSEVALQLDLPTANESIRCQGVVTWLNTNDQPLRPEMPAGFGVQFLTLKIADLFAVRAFIESLTKQNPGGITPSESTD